MENVSSCQQKNLSVFITSVAPGTKDVLNLLGVQTNRYLQIAVIVLVIDVKLSPMYARVNGLTKSQCNYLLNIKLVHLYKTLQLLVEWLELGMYDFCYLSFTMKVHLTDESKQAICQAVRSLGELHIDLIIFAIPFLRVSTPIKK